MKALILVLNSIGLVVYLAWLALGKSQIFYTQDGVLYLLPVIPFALIYALLLSRTKEPEEDPEELDPPDQGDRKNG